jgi:hypothetical protein
LLQVQDEVEEKDKLWCKRESGVVVIIIIWLGDKRGVMWMDE